MKYQKKTPTIDVFRIPKNCYLTIHYPRQIAEDDPVTYKSQADGSDFLVIDEYGRWKIMAQKDLEREGYIRVEEE